MASASIFLPKLRVYDFTCFSELHHSFYCRTKFELGQQACFQFHHIISPNFSVTWSLPLGSNAIDKLILILPFVLKFYIPHNGYESMFLSYLCYYTIDSKCLTGMLCRSLLAQKLSCRFLKWVTQGIRINDLYRNIHSPRFIKLLQLIRCCARKTRD